LSVHYKGIKWAKCGIAGKTSQTMGITKTLDGPHRCTYSSIWIARRRAHDPFGWDLPADGIIELSRNLQPQRVGLTTSRGHRDLFGQNIQNTFLQAVAAFARPLNSRLLGARYSSARAPSFSLYLSHQDVLSLREQNSGVISSTLSRQPVFAVVR
jgi:hypothetical protein